MYKYYSMTYTEFTKHKLASGLTKDQLLFFKEFLSSNQSIFLSGPGGVGKSFVVSKLYDLCLENGIFLSKTASTGIAALQVEAQTLHSFLGIGLGTDKGEILFRKIRRNKNALERVKSCKILLIDEISMISGELFDLVYSVFDYFCKKQPRYILCGDFLQLPPVFKDCKQFCFESCSWKKINPKNVILNEIVRQNKESDYAKFLLEIREGNKKNLDILDSRVIDETEIPKGALVAFSKNIDVEFYNEQKLREINAEEKVFVSSDRGQDPYISNLKKNCMAPETLYLRIGAQVMLLKNIPDSPYVNGSIGSVTRFALGGVYVKFDAGEIFLDKETWKIDETYFDISGKVKTKTLASRSQIPLKLAYASTIHKLQGITCDKIAVDLSSCFADGQVYVALSRAKTIDGLWITGFSKNSIKVNPKCLDFYKK